MALLVLTAGCDGATGTTAPADSVSSGGASAAAAVSATPRPASGLPSAPKVSPVAVPVRTTHQVATQVQQTHAPAPAPAPTTQAPQPVQTTVQPQSCYPLTDGGKCYTPGEYCRDDDHGTSGIDADGDPIECVDNDGWRWERE